MKDFTIGEMLSMQKQSQEQYKDQWQAISPAAGKHHLLWMNGEVGEVIDLYAKKFERNMTRWQKG